MTNRFAELTHDIQDRIREIAYLMWEFAGRQHGMAMEYWLAAEQEVLSTFQAAAHRLLPDLDAKPKPAEKLASLKVTAPSVAAPADEAIVAATAATGAKPATRRTPRTKAKVQDGIERT